MKDVDGVVLVYNPDIPTHETEIGIWCEFLRNIAIKKILMTNIREELPRPDYCN